MTTPPVLDRAALERLRRIGGSALVRQMLELFRDGAAQRLAAARAAVAEGDRPALGRAAHALVSSAGNVGAAELLAVARAAEELARAPDADMRPALARLEESIARLEGPLAAAEQEMAG